MGQWQYCCFAQERLCRILCWPAFTFTVPPLLGESLDTDNLSKGPESPESRSYPSLIDLWLIKYLNVHGVKQVVKCLPD